MSAGFATVTEEEGVVVTSADVNGFTVAELRFPPDFVQDEFEPELPYLALVLDGALEKSFRRRTIRLDRACALTMPVGATHGALFGSDGARIVIVKANAEPGPLTTGCLDRLVELRGHGLSWLAWRLAGELRASDAAAPLAAEGLALELLAATTREARQERPSGRPPAWLSAAEELLRTRIDGCLRLGELAAAIGVQPTHLARVFRAHHGVSVGEYGRRVRLEWAAAEIACTEAPIVSIATDAGFSDQSHFTRLFKRYVGTTPGRYRRETHARRVPG